MEKVYSLLREYAVKTLLKLSGWKAWVANLVFKKIWNTIVPALQRAWTTTLKKLRDSKALDKYADEIAKGKDADEQAKVDHQLDLLNPKP